MQLYNGHVIMGKATSFFAQKECQFCFDPKEENYYADKGDD